ncbi:hypothetical protein [Chitinophaga filiformis]|uniref:Uncharacterized protein n=1 Tax=Chitinophaga filiformis TaxID=104663 RepID=A0A1G7LYG4_CHIFI|nr:hypothetical protein [Chitinophaga filiformis]SDF54537.1 hypothetical protein SAMN04488121_102231 [Chitinophaga filiformis]
MEFNYSPGGNFQQQNIEAIVSRINFQSEQNDLPSLKMELQNAMFVLSKLIDLVHDKRVGFPKWMRHIEVLAIKFVQHTSSVNHLATPLPLSLLEDGNKVSAFDRASLFVIARAQIEAFLTFYYLIILPESHPQGEFYDMVYELSGLCGRQDMPTKQKSSQEQKTLDAARIAVLRKGIENHPYFSTLDGDMKRKVKGKKPPARLFVGWEELIKQSHLNERFFVPRWKYYSGYAHSEFISSLQMQSIFKDHKFVMSDVCKTVEMALMAVCVVITELLNLIPILQDDYSSIWSEEQRISIYFYSKIALKPKLKISRNFTPTTAVN